MPEGDQVDMLGRSLKQNLEHLLLMERLVTTQNTTSFPFISLWSSAENRTATSQVLQVETLSRDYLRRINESNQRIRHLEQDIERYKHDYERLEQSYHQQRSAYLEKQLASHQKEDQLEKIISDLKDEYKQETSTKERLQTKMEQELKRYDLQVKDYQQNIKEMQAIIDHNEELEHFNSTSQLNNEKYHELEAEIERLQIENNDYKNRLDQLDHEKLSSDEHESWSEEDKEEEEEEEEEKEDYIYQTRHSSLEQEPPIYHNTNNNNISRIPILASRSVSIYDQMNNNTSFKADLNQTILSKNEEVNTLTVKNKELEVELKQAMETIEFLRRQHQDDRETIKKLSDNNMIYLDQIKLLSEENKNLTFQQ